MASENKPQKRKQVSFADGTVEYPDLGAFQKLVISTKYHSPKVTSESEGGLEAPRASKSQGRLEAPSASKSQGRLEAPSTPKWEGRLEAPSVSSPDPRFSKEKRDAVNKFLRMMQDNPTHYRILGVSNDVNPRQLDHARYRLSLMLLPDRNGFKGAKECYQIVEDSFSVLSDPHRRMAYDESLWRPKKGHSGCRSASMETDNAGFEEDFATTAWGLEPGDDVDLKNHVYETDESDHDEPRTIERHIPPPNQEVVQIMKEMEGDVTTLIKEGAVATSIKEGAVVTFIKGGVVEAARLRIRNANSRINMASGMAPGTYTVKEKVVEPIMADYARMIVQLEGMYLRLAHGIGQSIIMHFEVVRKRQENQWPREWVDSILEAVTSAHTRAGCTFADPRRRKMRAKSNPGSSARQQIVGEPEDTIMVDAPVSPIEIGSAPLTAPLTACPKPGYTSSGRRILGYRGWYSTDIRSEASGDLAKGCLTKVQFIVEGPGRNTIRLLPGNEAGKAHKLAYFQQPESEQCFVPRTPGEDTHNLPVPTRVLAYAHYNSSRSIPDGVALCEASNGASFLISLAVLRDILEKTCVDAAIRKMIMAQQGRAQKLLEASKPAELPRLVVGNRHRHSYRVKPDSDSEPSDSDSEVDQLARWLPRTRKGTKIGRPRWI